MRAACGRRPERHRLLLLLGPWRGRTRGTNYLIPVDVKSAEDGELWDQSLRLTEVTRKLKAEAGNATHFVVFDACRNTLKLRKTGSRAWCNPRASCR